jgi:PEP-CTERM/exosortase A-associated glycosyltransferase
MKILHILNHSIPLHSGYSFRTCAILEQQKKLGWETFHVTSAKHTVAKKPIENIDGITFYRSNFPSSLVLKFPIINQLSIIHSLYQRLDEIIPKIKPNLLHAHSPALNGLAMIKVAKKYNLPMVYECRAFWEDAAVDQGTATEGDLRYCVTKKLETYVFKKVDAITTICEGLRDDIIQRGLSQEKITVIPNAVDINKFTVDKVVNEELRQKLGLKGMTVFGYIGSFNVYEGLLLLLDAMSVVLKSYPDTRLLLVGGGPQEEEINHRVKELGLNKQIILTGRVPHNDIHEFYSLVDIFVYPRLSIRLTELVTPLKPLEAMAQGKLVIASDVGGHKELIKHNETGFLFQACSHLSLAKIIMDVINNRDQWSRIQRTARKWVETDRNWENSVARYIKIVEKLNA